MLSWWHAPEQQEGYSYTPYLLNLITELLMEGKELQRVAASKAANTLAPASLSDKMDVDSSEKIHHPFHKLLLSVILLFLNAPLLRRPSHSRRTISILPHLLV